MSTRRILSLLLALCLVVSMAPVCALSAGDEASAEPDFSAEAAETASPEATIVPPAQVQSFRNFKAALSFVQTEQPSVLNLGETKYDINQLVQLREAMPEGGVLQFSAKWYNVPFSYDLTELNLNVTKRTVTPKLIDQFILLMPSLRKITMSSHHEMSNDKTIPLLEKYPEIEFVWLITIGHAYTIASDATAYSTFKHVSEGKRLKSSDLDVLKYAKGLKALDLGHHSITDLSFLLYFPDLEFLILADNKITDISVLGQLPHLKYVEIFMNNFTDLSPLANCPELLDLNICRTKVVDLSPLAANTALERLWTSRAPVSEESLAAVRAALPNCVISNTRSGDATGDGWRKHYRYKQYIKQLKAHVWTGFTPPEE